jgi:hypothetical protein
MSCSEGPETIFRQPKRYDDLQKFNKSDLSAVLGPFTVASDLGSYRNTAGQRLITLHEHENT